MLGAKEERRSMFWLSQSLLIIYDTMHCEENKWGMKYTPIPSKSWFSMRGWDLHMA